MAPLFEQANSQLEPEVRLVKVDSDAALELLQRFSIQGIPTLMLIHGREIARQSGLVPCRNCWPDPRAHHRCYDIARVNSLIAC